MENTNQKPGGKKTAWIIAIIVAVLLTAVVIVYYATRGETEPNTEQVAEQNETEEIDIAAVKEYLTENYEKFNIDGSTSMVPLHQSLENLFGSSEEEVTHSRTVDAFEKFINGENDILIGVDYSDELLEKARKSGVKLAKKEITKEAFVFLINKNNSVKSLTTAQIKDIYSGKITNWKDVGGDDAPIQAYQRNGDSGSQIRMNKFMGDAKLTENDVEYIQMMGAVIERIADYDEGKYSIAYNMYTFTEKQYANEEVILLSVDGVYPDDDTIFDDTYPINIYNYIYYDENNESVSEFADNLYIYLMSDEGQKMISDSGYVNLNAKYERNKTIDAPYYHYSYEFSERNIGMYNEETGEYYDADEDGNLVVFEDLADYILRGTKYEDNAKAREFLTLIDDSDVPKVWPVAELNEEKGYIYPNPWFDAAMDPEDFFNYKFDGKYYTYLQYHIDEDRYLLTTLDQEILDSYEEWLQGFTEYTKGYTPDTSVEITKEDLKELYLRTTDFVPWGEDDMELEFFKPFK